MVVLMLHLIQYRQNESVYGFLGFLRRVETVIDDAVKPSYTLVLVYLRANVLIDAYHDHVIVFAAWLPSGSCHLIHPKYFCNVAPTLNFF